MCAHTYTYTYYVYNLEHLAEEAIKGDYQQRLLHPFYSSQMLQHLVCVFGGTGWVRASMRACACACTCVRACMCVCACACVRVRARA